jgi:hypothetical protein
MESAKKKKVFGGSKFCKKLTRAETNGETKKVFVYTYYVHSLKEE